MKPMKSIFVDKIDYLDGKPEADFDIVVDFFSGAGKESGDKMRASIGKGLHIAGIYVGE